MDLRNFWEYAPEKVLQQLRSSDTGLSEQEALQRLASRSSLQHQRPAWLQDAMLLLHQFKSPLVLLLLMAVILSSFLGETSDAGIITVILLATGITGYIQERRAGRAVEQLRSVITTRVTVMRSGKTAEIQASKVVPGDILLFSAGNIIPADCLLLEERDIHVNEANLTGETFPAEKETGIIPADAPLAKRTNTLFEGTSIVSGTGKAVAVLTGKDTVFGSISESIGRMPEETAFEKGIKKFGYLLMQITIVLAVVILAVNVYFGKPLVEALLFGLALAVGMAPEMLPAIMTIAMSSGAGRMAAKKVIVKKLSSIQNLGEVNLLCSDKTGTLTEGVLEVASVVGVDGKENNTVRQMAYLNARFETGFRNPMDEALCAMKNVSANNCIKKDEVPYDFIRKRLSICVEENDKWLLITKGAVDNIVSVCTKVLLRDGSVVAVAEYGDGIQALYRQYSGEGFRTIGVCYKEVRPGTTITAADETDMIFAGFALLFDPPKADAAAIIGALNRNGVALKMITGDNKLVAAYMAQKIGLENARVVCGADIRKMSPEALVQQVQSASVFAEIEPQQKENIIKALRKAGNTVAYMGDGINDVAAINAADVGISINNAVDVAREAADVVLLEKDLSVLNAGIVEGRKTFLNTIKYIYTSTSATFGNMFSMAGASLLLPFLPMLPQQILMTNFLTDFPFMSVAGDNVDAEALEKPQRWNLKQLKRFMIVFGLHSSLFDYLTFFLLYRLYRSEALFHTGWFIESICTELLIVFVVRTRRPLLKSKPGKLLILLSSIAFSITVALPFTPFAAPLGFVVPPYHLAGIVVGILLLYVITADVLKRIFFRGLAI